MRVFLQKCKQWIVIKSFFQKKCIFKWKIVTLNRHRHTIRIADSGYIDNLAAFFHIQKPGYLFTRRFQPVFKHTSSGLHSHMSTHFRKTLQFFHILSYFALADKCSFSLFFFYKSFFHQFADCFSNCNDTDSKRFCHFTFRLQLFSWFIFTITYFLFNFFF